MSLEEKKQEVIEEFAFFGDDSDMRYEHIIDLGKKLKSFPDDKKTEDRLIEGCQSLVWLDYEFKDGKIYFSADSNSTITKGIIALLISVLNEEKPEDILKDDLAFIQTIGLHEHLSPSRSNGLTSMVKKIKMAALKALK